MIFRLRGREVAGGTVLRQVGHLAARGNSAPNVRVRTASILETMNRARYARLRVTVTGTRNHAAATGVKAPVVVRALVGAVPGGRSSPEAGADRGVPRVTATARAGKAVAAARATRLPEAGWPGHTVAAVHRAISAATPGSRRMSASI